MGVMWVVEALVAELCRWRWRRYEDYLLSWVWRSKRRRALRRAGNACQVCNVNVALEVHHRRYPALLGREPDGDLTVLCAAHHELFHTFQQPMRRRAARIRKRAWRA